jgi:hypothetical protein
VETPQFILVGVDEEGLVVWMIRLGRRIWSRRESLRLRGWRQSLRGVGGRGKR